MGSSPSQPDATARHFAFLADAGEVLASSLDYEQTLREVARLSVPELGDLCIVDVVEEGTLRRVAAAHAIPAKAHLLDELRRRYPQSPGSPQPADRVLRTKQPELLVDVTPEIVAAHTMDEEHAELVRALGIRSHLAVPLLARGTTVGVLSLAITESDRRYGAADEALARELARRAALAVDNARLYRAAQEELAERRRTEEALRLSESRFRAVMEQAPFPIQIYASDGRLVGANRAWEKTYGVTMEQVSHYVVTADPQLEARAVLHLVKRAFAGEAVEIPAIRYDPTETVPDRAESPDPVRWVRAFAYPVEDAEGAVREVVMVQEDVTARVQAEERLRTSEERLRMAMSAARMNVWDWDVATDRVECSEGARELWGTDIGRSSDFLRAVHPDDRSRLTAALRRATDGDGEPFGSEFRVLGGDGRLRWVQSRGRVEHDAEGRPRRLLGVTVDITDLKTAEESTRLLADAGELLGASLDPYVTLKSLTSVVVPRLADWCAIDLTNEAGELERVAVHHPDPARVELANELFRRFPPRRGAPVGVWHVIRTGQPEWAAEIDEATLEAVAHDPEHLALLHGLAPRSYVCVPLIARGTAIGALTLVHAESGRRYRSADAELAMDLARRAAAAVDNARLHQQLRAEDRRKDELLATLAHELRNPLAPIRSGLEILRLRASGAPTDKTIEIMERQLGHMVRLVDDLLDLSRVTRGKVKLQKERVELASVVASAIEASRPVVDAAGLDLAVRMPDEPIVLDADRTRLAQVLSNLIHNAAKYTERGGRIELDAVEEGSEAIIRVKDTGIGIPREMLTHVFEMFAQVGRSIERSQGGLGIGLTLVKRLVELHGGWVWAESEGPGRGSTFVVRLPTVTGPRLAPASRAREGRSSRSPRRVLVVDDNVDAAETLALLLELDGHDVRRAASGPSALEVLQDFTPDVAFLDIGMPGMSGYELARRIRHDPALSSVTLVAVTGWGQEEDRRESRKAGFDHHLTKPVEPRDLRAMV